jgi:hypothetical protein
VVRAEHKRNLGGPSRGGPGFRAAQSGYGAANWRRLVNLDHEFRKPHQALSPRKRPRACAPSRSILARDGHVAGPKIHLRIFRSGSANVFLGRLDEPAERWKLPISRLGPQAAPWVRCLARSQRFAWLMVAAAVGTAERLNLDLVVTLTRAREARPALRLQTGCVRRASGRHKTTCPRPLFSAKSSRHGIDANSPVSATPVAHSEVRHVDAPRNSRDRRGGCGPPRSLPYSPGAAPYLPLRAGWALGARALRGLPKRNLRERLAGAIFAAISV